MVIPSWFAEQLRSEQGTTYRVRWSNARSCYVIEQKAGRGLATPPSRLMKKLEKMKDVPDQIDEILIRARDGYLLFLEVHPSGRAGCPKCGSEVKLKPREWQYAVCGVCKKDFPAVFFELGDDILQHLRYLDIHRGGDERIIEDQDRENAQKQARERRELNDSAIGPVLDDWRQIFDIPMVGYTGKEFVSNESA